MIAAQCKFPFNSEYTESDDIKCCEEKLNSLPFIHEIRNFVSTGNVEFVNTDINSLEKLNTLLQSIVYVGLDHYDAILLEFFWNDARSTSSQLLKSVAESLSFTWKSEIENYYFVKEVLCQSKKQYLTMAINQTDCSCEEAARRGNLRLLKWLRSKNVVWSRLTCVYAASGGHFEVLKCARERGCVLNEWTCVNAAFNGHLEILKWLREHECPWDRQTCTYAAMNGHSEVVKWAREHGCPE